MEYFVIKSSVTAAFLPILLDTRTYKYRLTKENFAQMPESEIYYFHQREEEEIPDLLLSPTFLCGDALKRIVSLYDASIGWKSIYMMPDEEEKIIKGTVHYWIPDMARQKCLHKDCAIQPNGAVEKLILDQRRLRNVDIFQVEETLENNIIVSLALAESISRRHLYGVVLERVEVR